MNLAHIKNGNLISGVVICIIDIGGTYRVNNAYAGIAGVKISKLLKVGYAYEINFKNEFGRLKIQTNFSAV